MICWTLDGANNRHYPVNRQTGGTGTAISLAGKFDIPVLNLCNQNDVQQAYELVKHNGFIQTATDLSDTVQPWVLDDVIKMLELIQL